MCSWALRPGFRLSRHAQPGRRLDLVDHRPARLRPAVPGQVVADRLVLTLLSLFIFRRFMAERSIAYIVGCLTVVATLLGAADRRHVLRAAPLDRGAHRRRRGRALYRAHRHRARFPPGPDRDGSDAGLDRQLRAGRLKATFFAVMASFTNLALSASQLGTKYLNQIFVVTREVKNPETGEIVVPADYSELGLLLISVTAIGFVLPLLAILILKRTRFRNA